MLASLGWAVILGDVRGFFWRDFSSRVSRFVASGDAIFSIMYNSNEICYVCRDDDVFSRQFWRVRGGRCRCVAVAVRIEVTANMVRGKGERAFLLAAYGKNAYQILIKRFKFTDLPSNLTLSLLK